jgi:hypothetical protein
MTKMQPFTRIITLVMYAVQHASGLRITELNYHAAIFLMCRRGVSKLDYMNPRITASPRRPAGGGAMP